METSDTASDKLNPDQLATLEFLAEIRTRLCVQHIPYKHGIEVDALKSLWTIFDDARLIMRKYPEATEFAVLVTQFLNEQLRPVTGKWHRPYELGELILKTARMHFAWTLDTCRIGFACSQ